MRANSKHQPSGASGALTLGVFILVIGILFWAREVLIPIALAILITFILAPIVNALRRHGVGHKTSVILTVVLTFFAIAVVGILIVSEFKSLANDLPTYRQNIRKKITSLQMAMKGGSLEKIQNTVQDVLSEFEKGSPSDARSADAVPVVVKGSGKKFDLVMVTSVFQHAATTGLVIILVIFMLLRREELRDRLLRIAGYGRLVVTTKAIDEAGKHVSRYLFRQFLVNTGYGVAVGIGLWAIGLPYSLLWGFLAGVARFIPYAGPVIGATSPILMSLAVFEGWTVPLGVIVLILGLELVTNMMVEPVVYGKGIGVSEVALLVMMSFWTWLWGGLGLILAAPLTVCLMVISKSIPRLEFISLLLSCEPAMEGHRVLYHRLIAKDEAEASRVVEEFVTSHSRVELFEQLFVPILIACRHDHQQNQLTDEDRQFVFQFIRKIIEAAPDANGSETPVCDARILGCPANDEADELSLLMLAESVKKQCGEMRVLSSEMFSAEALVEADKTLPKVVCVGILPQATILPARQLCKRLRSHFPNIPIILARWNEPNQEETRAQFSEAVDEFGWSLAETQNLLIQYAQVEPSSG